MKMSHSEKNQCIVCRVRTLDGLFCAACGKGYDYAVNAGATCSSLLVWCAERTWRMAKKRNGMITRRPYPKGRPGTRRSRR